MDELEGRHVDLMGHIETKEQYQVVQTPLLEVPAKAKNIDTTLTRVVSDMTITNRNIAR
jgi:hypothetical protein